MCVVHTKVCASNTQNICVHTTRKAVKWSRWIVLTFYVYTVCKHIGNASEGKQFNTHIQ